MKAATYLGVNVTSETVSTLTLLGLGFLLAFVPFLTKHREV